MNSPRLPPTSQDDDERDRKHREDDSRRRRWTCWGVALALVLIWVVFVALDEGRRIGALPPGANNLFLVLVMVLLGAGWILGRDDQTAELIELSGRNAALAETIIHLETAQNERLGVYVRQAQRLVGEVHQLAEDLGALGQVAVVVQRSAAEVQELKRSVDDRLDEMGRRLEQAEERARREAADSYVDEFTKGVEGGKVRPFPQRTRPDNPPAHG